MATIDSSVPGEPPHIPGPILGATRRQHSRGNAGGIGLRRGNSAIGVTVGGVADLACTTGSIRSLACGDCVSRCRSTGSSSGRRSSCSDAAADCRSLPPIDVSPPALRKQLDHCYHRSSACEKRCSSGDTAAGSTRFPVRRTTEGKHWTRSRDNRLRERTPRWHLNRGASSRWSKPLARQLLATVLT